MWLLDNGTQLFLVVAVDLGVERERSLEKSSL